MEFLFFIQIQNPRLRTWGERKVALTKTTSLPISDDRVQFDKVVAVFVTDGHAVAAIVLKPVSFGNAAAYAPTKEKAIFIVFDGATMDHLWPLGAAPRM